MFKIPRIICHSNIELILELLILFFFRRVLISYVQIIPLECQSENQLINKIETRKQQNQISIIKLKLKQLDENQVLTMLIMINKLCKQLNIIKN